jgi:hypothetical protein
MHAKMAKGLDTGCQDMKKRKSKETLLAANSRNPPVDAMYAKMAKGLDTGCCQDTSSVIYRSHCIYYAEEIRMESSSEVTTYYYPKRSMESSPSFVYYAEEIRSGAWNHHRQLLMLLELSHPSSWELSGSFPVLFYISRIPLYCAVICLL